MNEPILKNLESVQNRIRLACEKSNRNPYEVKLLLATKTVSADKIKMVLQSGETLIGENKIQEIKDKYEELKDTLGL